MMLGNVDKLSSSLSSPSLLSCQYHRHQSIIAILPMCFSCFSPPPISWMALMLTLTLLFVIGDKDDEDQELKNN